MSDKRIGERLVGRQAIADYLQRSTTTVDKLRETQGLPAYHIGGIVEARTNELDDWLDWQRGLCNRPDNNG